MQQKSVAIAKSLDTAPALHSKILEIYAEKLKEYGINPKRYVPRCGISHGMVNQTFNLIYQSQCSLFKAVFQIRENICSVR